MSVKLPMPGAAGEAAAFTVDRPDQLGQREARLALLATEVLRAQVLLGPPAVGDARPAGGD